MKLSFCLTTLVTLIYFVEGCKPKSNCVNSGGGKGGTATISISPTHYDSYVDSCTIYIKYGSLDEPANNVYDDSQKCVMIDTIPVATFSNLKAGLYYFMGKGFHTSFHVYVIGATNYIMCNEHSVSMYLPTDQYFP